MRKTLLAAVAVSVLGCEFTPQFSNRSDSGVICAQPLLPAGTARLDGGLSFPVRAVYQSLTSVQSDVQPDAGRATIAFMLDLTFADAPVTCEQFLDGGAQGLHVLVFSPTEFSARTYSTDADAGVSVGITRYTFDAGLVAIANPTTSVTLTAVEDCFVEGRLATQLVTLDGGSGGSLEGDFHAVYCR